MSGASAESEGGGHGFFRSAGTVSAAVFLSRITGLVREMAMARLFGAGRVYDAFLLGFRIPNLTRDLFAEGALSSAFVPIFTRYLATRGKREAAELSNLTATLLLIAACATCAVGMIFSPALVRLMAPGFERVPGKFALAVLLTRVMFPFLALVALAAQAMGVLNACGRFGVPALASAVFNVGVGGRRPGAGIHHRAQMGARADRMHGLRRGGRRRAAVVVAGAQPVARRLRRSGRGGIRGTPACAPSRG